jgi:hypothetical protein
MRPRMLRAFVISLVLLTGLAGVGLCDAPAPARRANAHKLVRLASEACTEAIRALPQAPASSPQLLPLHDALIRMQSSLLDVGSRLAARDLRYFQALRAGTRTLAEVRLVRSREGLQRAAVDSRIEALSALYARLRNRYGREWLRYSSGRPLDEQERRRFAQVQAAQALFVSTLNPLLDRARSQGEQRTADALGLLVAQANRIAQAPPVLDELLNASILADTIEGEYAATRDAQPADDPQWNDADRVVEQIQTDSSIGFVFTTNLDAVEAWSWTEEETDLPDAVAALPAQTFGSSEPDLLSDALALRSRTDAPPAGQAEDDMTYEEPDELWGEEEASALESPDGAEILELPADAEEGVASAASESATVAPAAPEADCTAESAPEDCARPLLQLPVPAVPPPAAAASPSSPPS